MNTKEIQPFIPDPSWREHNGALLVIAHPDDEVMLGWGVIQTFVDAGIPVTVLLTTLGENGKVYGSSLSPEETKAVRQKEFAAAMGALSANGVISTPLYPDSDMSRHQQSLNESMTKFVREGRFDVIVSFAPGERTYRFDHRDHHAVSQAALMASEVADMPAVFPRAARPLSYRPAFLGWTTNPDIGAVHQMSQVPLSEQSRKKRTEFLTKHYTSQFSEKTKQVWEPIFERLTQGEPNNSHRQLLFRIR